MPLTRQARRFKENTSCSRSQSQTVEQSFQRSEDDAVLELNTTNAKKIVTPDETFAAVLPEEKIDNNSNKDAVGTIMEKNNNNQKTDDLVYITRENNNDEKVYVASMDDIKTGEKVEEKKRNLSGDVEFIITAEDDQMVDDNFEDETLVENDFENNYENTSLDLEETISVSASDMVDSSEVEWEEVFMENVEEVVVSVTTPIKNKKLVENDLFPAPQDDNVEVLLNVVEMEDNEDGSHIFKEFDKKLIELDNLAGEEYGSPAKADIDDWMAEYSNSSYAAVQVRTEHQPPPLGQGKVVVERRQGLLGMWTPHHHTLHSPAQGQREDGDEATEEPMVKIVDCQEVEETVSVEVVTSQLDTSSDAENQVIEGRGDVTAVEIEENETVTKRMIEHERVSASIVKKSPIMTTPVSREQLLKERFNLPPGVSLTLVTTPDHPAPAGTRWDRKVMVMETKIKEKEGSKNIVDLTDVDHEYDEVMTKIVARHIVVKSEEVDLKEVNSQKVAGKKRAPKGRGTGTGKGKGRNVKEKNLMLVSMRKSLLKKPGILEADSFLSNRLSLPQLRSCSSSQVDGMNTGGRSLKQRYSMQALVRTRMPQPVPALASGPTMAGQVKSPRGFASYRGSPFRYVSPGGMVSQGHASASGALVPVRSYHTPSREGFLSPRSTLLSPRCRVLSPHPRFQCTNPGFSSPRMGLVSPSTGLLRRGQMTPEQTYSSVGKMSPVVLNRIHSPLRMMSPTVLNNSPLGMGPRPIGLDCPRKFDYSRIEEKFVPNTQIE